MSAVQNIMIPGPIGQLSVRTKGADQGFTQAVVLVQGANMSGQMGYDFSFPGGDDYSTMDALVAAGYVAVTFSVRGYALSDGPPDPFEVQTEQAIEDLAAVMDWMNLQGFPRPHLLGWSWGGRITGRWAEDNSHRIDRLVLLDPAIGGGNKILPGPTEPWWINTHDYFFDRLEAEFGSEESRHALGRRMEAEEPRAPNGIRVENAKGSVAVVPTKITCPTLMLYGAAAGQQNYMQGGWDRLKFYEALNTEDKAFVLIPGGGDYAHLQNPRQRLFAVIAAFIGPAARAS